MNFAADASFMALVVLIFSSTIEQFLTLSSPFVTIT